MSRQQCRLIGFLAVLALPALAEEVATLESVTVTAQKFEQGLQDVPLAITAIDRQELQRNRITTVAEVLGSVPSITIAPYVNSTNTLFLYMRGIGINDPGQISTDGAVGLYQDGFYISRPQGINFDVSDIQRVEVLRGPQGTLYGANSEGGLLKFVTAPPVLGTFSGVAEVTGESIDHGGKGGDVRAVVNLPIGDKVALRVGGFDEEVAGYIKDPSRGKTDLNEGHKYGGRVSLLADPVDSLTIRLTATSQQSRYDGTPNVDVNPVTLKPAFGDLVQNRLLNEPSDFQYKNYNATINWDAGPFSILSTTSYGILNSDFIVDYTNVQLVPGFTVQDLLTSAIGPGLGAYVDDLADLNKFTQEVRISSPATNFLEWQVGGYFTRETGHLYQHLNAVNLPSGSLAAIPSLEVPILDSTYKERAGFANLTVHFIPQFDVQAGGRYSKNEQTATESITGLLVPTQAFSTPSSGHVFTYSVAPRWHVDADNMVYLRWATGYRPGGPNALPPVAPPDVPREYSADKTSNIELGVKSSLLQGLLSIDASIFHVDWTDIQLLEQVDNTGINGNGGKARSQGFESAIGYVPLHGFTLQWTGAYTDAKLTTDAPAVHGHTGDPLPYAPKWGTSLDGEYDAAAFAAFVGATWSYVGARETGFGTDATGLTQVRLSSYDSYAARVGLDNDRYRVTLYGKNLSDSRGITNYVSQGAPGLNGDISVIQPRTFGVTLSAKF